MIPPVGTISLGAKIIAGVTGFDFRKLKPLIPYIATFVAAWMIQGWRLDAKQVQGQLQAKDVLIAQERSRTKTAIDLADMRKEAIGEWKSLKADAEKTTDKRDEQIADLIARQPKDTLKIIKENKANDQKYFTQNPDDKCLRRLIPDGLLDNSRRRIRNSQEFGLPAPTLAGNPTGTRQDDPSGRSPGTDG